MMTKTGLYFAMLATALGLGVGISTTASADYGCARECRNQYNACLTGCGTNAYCRTVCFYNYENCLDGCAN